MNLQCLIDYLLKMFLLTNWYFFIKKWYPQSMKSSFSSRSGSFANTDLSECLRAPWKRLRTTYIKPECWVWFCPGRWACQPRRAQSCLWSRSWASVRGRSQASIGRIDPAGSRSTVDKEAGCTRYRTKLEWLRCLGLIFGPWSDTWRRWKGEYQSLSGKSEKLLGICREASYHPK